jgi:hypothetical protein
MSFKAMLSVSFGFMCFISGAEARMSDAELTLALRRELEPHIITVNAPKLVFHWTNASDILPRGQFNQQFPVTAPSFAAFIDTQGRKIFNRRSERDPDIEGPGLYMASDPVVSREYGGQRSFGLIVGLLKPGARLIASRSMPMSNALKLELQARSCSATTFVDLLDTADQACTRVKQLLVGRDISFADGRLYSWGSQEVPGCRSRSNFSQSFTGSAAVKADIRHHETFVIYSRNAFSEVYGYTNLTVATGAGTGARILSWLKSLEKSGEINTWGNKKLVSDEQLADARIPVMTNAQIRGFSTSFILGCQ